MLDGFSMCPICGQGIIVSQVIEDNQSSERIECYRYSCGHKLDRVHISVKTGIKAGLKTKSRNGAFIGRKKREYEIEDRYRNDDRDYPGKETIETVFIHHGTNSTSAFHVVKYSESEELKHIDCKTCGNGWRFNSVYPLENYFLIEHNPKETYLHCFKIQCLKCNAKYENPSE
jgi:hypothetical protein